MSTVLSIYSQRAFLEYVLPIINNAETSIIIEHSCFSLQEDIILKLEVVDTKRHFGESSEKESLIIFVEQHESSFVVYEKCWLDTSNIRYSIDSFKKSEIHRFEVYSEYLIKCTNIIKQKYVNNIQVMNDMYPSTATCCLQVGDSVKLWKRNTSHADFLNHRLDYGDLPFQVPIQIPEEKFILINDTLTHKPKFIKDYNKGLHGVLVCVNLFNENNASEAENWELCQ